VIHFGTEAPVDIATLFAFQQAYQPLLTRVHRDTDRVFVGSAENMYPLLLRVGRRTMALRITRGQSISLVEITCHRSVG
jgi:hypothetical protein